MKYILKIDQVYKYFGGVKANQNISLAVEKESIVGLIGPNGSGKTTLFNSIVGTHPIDNGSINFDGKEATFYLFEPNEEGWFELPLTNYKIGTAKRVSEDWQLPDPPKGLPKLEEVSDVKDGEEIPLEGDAPSFTEEDEQNASEK